MTTPAFPHIAGRRSAQAYASVGLETQVLSASPQQLITLLFQGALAAIAKARLYMQSQNIAGRGTAISKAIDIVDAGLKASIDTNAGKDVAHSLIATYDLVIHHLLLANLNADEDSLTIAENMLTDISQAWKEVSGQTHDRQQPPAA